MTNSKPINEHIEKARIKLFEKILLFEENSPAYSSMIFAISNYNNLKSRKRRPRCNLLSLLQKDMKQRNLEFNTVNDIENLKVIVKEQHNLPDTDTKINI